MSEEARSALEVCDYSTDNRSLSLDNASSIEESTEGTLLSLETSSELNPFIGQRFVTHDDAYHFYSEFAKHCGFSIRRHRTEGKDGIGKGLTRRYFVCHRAGHTPLKVLSDLKPQRNRRSSRCGCQAYMRISKIMELGIPEWRVTGFANLHNHELLEPNQVRFLPAYRTISGSDKSRILMFAKTGISVQQMMRLMELEKCVEPGFLPFTEKDVRNLLQAFKKMEQDDESTDLLKMCSNMKDRDANFRYEYTVDVNHKLENIAWFYASSVKSYAIFGDAVVFDTTHRLTAFDMHLGIWVGIDSYGMPCFFGCVCLKEENSDTFSWALQVFLNTMNGKAPQTILTDQNLCLKEAIERKMPQTKHAFCLWLLTAKFPSWFNAVLGERYDDWKSEFQRLYNLDVADDFEHGWREMVNLFGLQSNRHIANLFAFRSFWALPYLRHHFFAGLTAAGASKSLNAFIQRFLTVQTHMAQFVEQVAIAVDFRDPEAEHQTMQQNGQNIILKTGSPMESHAASILTPYAFCKLQEEFVMATQFVTFPIEEGFLVRLHEKNDGGCKVTWLPHEGILSCSCHMFEFSGILCRHSLRVLCTVNCFQIPESYLPVRWRRLHLSTMKMFQGAAPTEHLERVHALQLMVSTLVSEAMKSKERLDMTLDEVSILLSRVREQSSSPLRTR